MPMAEVVELATLDENIEAYERRRDEMEAKYRDQWVVFVDEEFVEAFDDFQEAAMMAIRRWGKGPYLIRLVGEEPRMIPMSLIGRSVDAARWVWVTQWPGLPCANRSPPGGAGWVRSALSPTRRTTEHPG